jgi:uncharacterized protein DUF3658
MTREQAAEIHRHLLSAKRAINRVAALIYDLEPIEDRKPFGEPISNAYGALQHEMLDKVIYRQFPDLRPPSKERPRIDSKLTWDKVKLPPSITVMDFDRIILSELSHHARKTARIVGNVSEHYRQLGIDLDPAIAAARLMAMVDSGLIEGAGNLRMWRFSEVRLKAGDPPTAR